MKIKTVIESLGKLSCVNRFSQSYLSKPENVMEHTGFVALMSLAIAKDLIRKDCEINVGLLLEKALVHDLDEIITGDVTRSTKYSSDEMLSSMNLLSQESINKISTDCDCSFNLCWASAKEGKEGSIVSLADCLSVLFKAHNEVVMRGNKTIDFGGTSKLRENVICRICDLENIIGAKIDANFIIDINSMINEINEVMKK